MRAAGGVRVDRATPWVEVETRTVARRRVRWPRWTDACAALAAHPAFAGCSPRQIRAIARAGDTVEIEAGTPIVTEDRIGYWFLAIFDGTIGLSRKGRPVCTLGPGDRIGDIAIVGFGPNVATATALSTVRAFVIGRRHLIALADVPAIQMALFGCTGIAYRDLVRKLRRDGDSAWRALPRGRPPVPLTRETLPAGVRLHASKALPAPSLAEIALTRLPSHDRQEPRSRPASPRTIAVAVAIATCVVVAALAVVGLTVKPRVAVVTAARPVDITDDIAIDGAPAHRVNGRYVVVAVHIERPTLAGWAWAVTRGRRIERLPDGGDGAESRRLARDEFLASRDAAAKRALADRGIDATKVRVRLRDRALVGPSAGLLYALAIEDMLGTDDLARGRTIAATGVIDESGQVTPVGWIALKARAADAAHADVFLVPRGQEADASTRTLSVVPVSSVAQARSALEGVSTR